jgi:hypothetical protein
MTSLLAKVYPVQCHLYSAEPSPLEQISHDEALLIQAKPPSDLS